MRTLQLLTGMTLASTSLLCRTNTFVSSLCLSSIVYNLDRSGLTQRETVLLVCRASSPLLSFFHSTDPVDQHAPESSDCRLLAFADVRGAAVAGVQHTDVDSAIAQVLTGPFLPLPCISTQPFSELQYPYCDDVSIFGSFSPCAYVFVAPSAVMIELASACEQARFQLSHR